MNKYGMLLFILNSFETIMSRTLVGFLQNLAVSKDVHHCHHAGFGSIKTYENSLLGNSAVSNVDFVRFLYLCSGAVSTRDDETK